MAGLRGSEAHCGRFWWILSNNLRGFLLNKSVKSNMISTNQYISMVVFVISNQKMTFICLPKQDSISYKEKMAHSFWTKVAYFGFIGLQKSLQMRPLWCRFMCIAEVSSLFPGLKRSAGPGPISDVGGPTEPTEATEGYFYFSASNFNKFESQVYILKFIHCK